MTIYLSSFFNYSQQQSEIPLQNQYSTLPVQGVLPSLKESYIDLEVSASDVRNSMINEHFRYAAYMYMGFSPDIQYDGNEKGVLLSAPSNISSPIQARIYHKHTPILKEITSIFIHTMGFKIDPNGNYYHTETGTCFNLIYDIERREIIVCFMGLNTYHHLTIEDSEKKQLDKASKYAAVSEVLGYTPSSIPQAIQIGKVLKEFSGDATHLTSIMVGHSHGGGLAQTASVANGLKAIIFNSRPIGSAAKNLIGQELINQHSNKITAFSVKGDWLTDKQSTLSISSIFENVLGVSNIGQGYFLPNLDKETQWTNHGGFYRSFQILKEMKVA